MPSFAGSIPLVYDAQPSGRFSFLFCKGLVPFEFVLLSKNYILPDVSALSGVLATSTALGVVKLSVNQ